MLQNTTHKIDSYDTCTHTHTHNVAHILLQAPARDFMLSQFTKQPANIMRNSEELEKVKCALISTYATNLTTIFSVASLRLQIIRSYQCLLQLLDDFPAIKAAYFIVGESKTTDPTRFSFAMQYAMDPSGKLMAAEVHRSKPHQLITRDGRVVLNLFYIPHYTEVGGGWGGGVGGGAYYFEDLLIFFAVVLDFEHV